MNLQIRSGQYPNSLSQQQRRMSATSPQQCHYQNAPSTGYYANLDPHPGVHRKTSYAYGDSLIYTNLNSLKNSNRSSRSGNLMNPDHRPSPVSLDPNPLAVEYPTQPLHHSISPSYATLPSKQSAFRPLVRAPIKPPRRCNNSELEEYARQYEDLYSRRMWGKSGAGSVTSSTTDSNSSCNKSSTIYTNGSWKVKQDQNNKFMSLNESSMASTYLMERPLNNNSMDYVSTLPRPPRAFNDNNNKDLFSKTKNFFQDINPTSSSSSTESKGYSSMSLPRKMPVKKLVSVFNSQIQNQSNVNSNSPNKPLYSTLQRKIKARNNKVEDQRSLNESRSQPLRRKSESNKSLRELEEEWLRGRRSSLTEFRLEEEKNAQKIIEEWKIQVERVRLRDFRKASSGKFRFLSFHCRTSPRPSMPILLTWKWNNKG